MPIKSFIAFPAENSKVELKNELEALDGFEVIEAENKEVLILVTDIKDKTVEKELLAKVEALPSCHQLSMVAGYNDPVVTENTEDQNNTSILA